MSDFFCENSSDQCTLHEYYVCCSASQATTVIRVYDIYITYMRISLLQFTIKAWFFSMKIIMINECLFYKYFNRLSVYKRHKCKYKIYLNIRFRDFLCIISFFTLHFMISLFSRLTVFFKYDCYLWMSSLLFGY